MIKRSDKDNLQAASGTQHAAGASTQALLDAIRNQGDLFFRAEDIALCDRLCDQLLHGGSNVALTGTNRAAIDHYGKILARRLRGLQDARVEVFLPSTSEALIARFNEILATRPMAEAMQDRSNETESTVRILFSPEARSMSAREGRLLARLVSSFPGANTRLVLLHDENEDSDQQQVLELLGKRLLRWPVLPPTEEEAALLLDAATTAGLGGDARILLERVRPVRRQRSVDQLDDRAEFNRQVNSDDLSPLDPDSPAGRFRARTGMAAQAPMYADTQHDSAPMHDDSHDQAPEAESSVTRLLWNGVLAIALVIAALLAAAAVFPRQTQALMALAGGLWQSEAPAQVRVDTLPEEAEPALRLPPVTPAVNTPSEPVTAAAEAATASTAATTTGANTEAAAPVTAAAAPPAVAAAATPAAPTTIAVPTTPPQKLTAPAAPVAAPVAATTATTTATTTPTVSGDVSAAIDKIKSMNKNSFFVQHIALDNAEEAQLWRRQYPALSGAMVTAIQVEGGRRIKYVVVSGPFADRTAANEYAKRAEIPQDSWIRTVRSLQDAAPLVAARRP